MAKKRATLPNDFSNILENNDFEAFQKVFEKCDINAYERDFIKKPALCFYGIPTEWMRWLIENGADIEAADTYGRTALWHHSSVNAVEKVQLLLDLGANINTADRYQNSVLHASRGKFEVVALLLERGADISAKNDRKLTPLQAMLSGCTNLDIPQVAKSAALLLKSGEKITKTAKEAVVRIGENFEFHRKNFNSELLEETDKALQRLYALFKVEPVTQRLEHDGVSPITVADAPFEKQFSRLWDLLVPSQGAAKTVQGEVVRISGKIRNEILRNASGNWDKEFKKMLSAMVDYLQKGNALSSAQMEEVNNLKTVLYDGDDNGDNSLALAQLAVAWVKQNETPIALGKVDYKR
ncbi:ankyrin repeat domain-containing protein [Capnocytophaga sp.]|uniref:ankyrin repeat domain-containing protein n=1 Tax=Capnocytophaga sp. TaxID=44737 RepID=UPI0026DBBDF5|nr:ankyrin repeat domain-containing protein [Capnocytophaga sp.]MDO5106576.1 ankyrin repeat domain-containing protein [Capnocytophaga sp.]